MRLKRKNNSSGESLSELLIASLIVSLAMIMLFSGVKVGSDIRNNSQDKFQQYNVKMNEYEESQASYVLKYGALGQVEPYPEPTPYSFSVASMSPHK